MTDCDDSWDCAVCLQSCNHPTKLPCGHIFCFLCVKGVAIQNKFCALCRQQIPINYLDNPVLLENENSAIEEQEVSAYQWYYEGRNGWWKYDERSNKDLEARWEANEPDCLLLIAGALYKVDFQTMLQTRRNDPTRRRHVRRDSPTLPSKGIAGIKMSSSGSTEKGPELDANIEEISETENDETTDEIGGNASSDNTNSISDDSTLSLTNTSSAIIGAMRSLSINDSSESDLQSQEPST